MAVLVAEVGSLILAGKAIASKARFQSKLDQLNELVQSALLQLATLRANGTITDADLKSARDQIGATHASGSQLLNARIQECQDELDGNLMMNLAEWFQDMTSDGLPHPPHKKVPQELRIGALPYDEMKKAMTVMAGQSDAVYSTLSATALVVALQPSDNAELLAFAQVKARDASLSPALRTVYLRIARVLSTMVDSRPVEFWSTVYESAGEDPRERREAVAACYRANDEAAWQLCTTAYTQDASPIVRLFAAEILGSIARAVPSRAPAFWKLANLADADADSARRLGTVHGAALFGADERAVAYLRARSSREPNAFIRGAAIAAWAHHATESDLGSFFGATALDRFLDKGSSAAADGPSSERASVAEALSILLDGLRRASARR